jgi:hypothetical protein
MGLTKPRAAQIFNLDYKQSTRVVTTTNITLSGGAPSLVDGITLSLGDRILVTAQTTGTQNGLYYVATLGSGANGTWARTSDGNENGEIEAGMIVMVTEGTIYADTQWKLITDDPIIINTTALTFTQNYMANSISSGTSNVVVNSNANVTISSAGTANVLTVSNTGAFVSGAASALGNITGSNLITGGVVTATGNVFANYFIGNGACLTGVVTSLANINNGNSNVTVIANSNVTVGIGGTSNVAVFATDGEYITGVLSATGNVTGGNIRTAGLITATGNVNGGNLGTAGTVLASGALSVVGATVFNNSGTASDSIGSNKTTGIINIGSTGGTGALNIGQSAASQSLLLGTGATTSGNTKIISIGTSALPGSTTTITVGPTSGTGGSGTATFQSFTTVAIANTSGTALSVAGNITGGNVLTGGLISATSTITSAANITGGNLLTGGLISATGNLFAGNALFSGNLTVNGNVTYINSNVVTINDLAINLANNAATAAAADGGGIEVGPQGSPYITWLYNNSANTFTSSAGISAVGNISGSNLRTAGVVTATGNITGGNILTAGLVSATSTITSASNITGGNLLTSGLISATSTITSAANITGGNILTVGQISATGNVTGNFFIGNGAFLTGLSAGTSNAIANGATRIDIPVASGNIAMSVAGQANTVVINLGSFTMYGTFAGPKNLNANVTVADSVNAVLFGPVSLGNAYNITVPDSSTLYVYSGV